MTVVLYDTAAGSSSARKVKAIHLDAATTGDVPADDIPSGQASLEVTGFVPSQPSSASKRRTYEVNTSTGVVTAIDQDRVSATLAAVLLAARKDELLGRAQRATSLVAKPKDGKISDWLTYAAAVEALTSWDEAVEADPSLPTADDDSLRIWARLYRRGNVLGTVSLASGLPTGGLIERGSNANGEYVRWADGTQMCASTTNVSADASTAYGSRYRSSAQAVTFAAEFSTTTGLRVLGAPINNVQTHEVRGRPTSTTQGELMFFADTSQTGRTGGYVALGRWA